MVRSALLASLAVAFSLTAASRPYAQDPLQERLNAAIASHALRQAYFDANGEPPLTLEQAFPHLAGAPLADPSFLAARRQILIAQTDACARERLVAGTSEQIERVRATCDAEDASVLLEQRLLGALTVGLELAPGFAANSIELARRPWREARERAANLADDDPDFPDAARAALMASEAERQLLLFQASALRRMTVPTDSTLSRLVERELSNDGEADPNVQDRLRRSAPLVRAELSSMIASALESRQARQQEQEELAAELTAAAREAATTTEGEILSSAAALRETENTRHAEALDAIQNLETRYLDLDAEVDEARALSILDEERRRRFGDAHSGINGLLRSTRDRFATLAALRREHDEERRQLSEEPAVPASDPTSDPTSNEATSNALAELVAALEDRDSNTDAEAQALLAIEKRARVLRRAIAPITGEQLTSQVFVDELVNELDGAPQWLELEWDEDVRWLRSVPQQATDLNAIGRALELSFDLLILALVWIYVRRQATQWLRRFLETFQKKEVSRFGFSRRSRHIADRELAPVGRYATDALGALVLHRLLVPRSELLALLALVWLGIALLRCVPAAIRLLLPILGRALDPLEADSEPPAEVLALGESTTNWFLRWWILSKVAAFIAVPLLQADRFLQ